MQVKGLEKFDELVNDLSSLPTIGKKTALRLAYYLCNNNSSKALKLAQSIEEAIKFTKACNRCGALSENELCEICLDQDRDKTLLCLVQSQKDIFVLEESKSYNGFYFVLQELDEKHLQNLENMIKLSNTKELIFAFTHSINSDAMIFYIQEHLKNFELSFSKIAQGIPSGIELENVDFISLNKAMNFRTKT